MGNRLENKKDNRVSKGTRISRVWDETKENNQGLGGCSYVVNSDP